MVGAALPKLALAVFALAFELEGLPCAFAVVVRGREREALAFALAGRGEVVDIEPPALAVTAFGRFDGRSFAASTLLPLFADQVARAVEDEAPRVSPSVVMGAREFALFELP